MLRGTKILDERNMMKCFIGHGVMRVEAWADKTGKVTAFNLAFINHALCRDDDGRVRGGGSL
jgi:hypothetical protein